MMAKYVRPEVEIIEVETADIMAISMGEDEFE